MNIVTNLVRVLVFTFVFVGGAITFAGPKAIKDNSAIDFLEPATVSNRPDQDRSSTEASAARRKQDVG